MNEKDDKITHLGILSNLENGRKLAPFSNSPGTGELSEKAGLGCWLDGFEGPGKGVSEPMVLPEENEGELYSLGCKWMYTFNRWEAIKFIPAQEIRWEAVDISVA